MALPAYIPVRTVGFRGVIELEQGKGLTAKVAVRSSGSLRWADTGELFETLGGTFTSGRGASVTFPLPVTDDDGWLTTANEIIDVSEGGAYTHTYTATVVVMDASGRQVGDVYEYGPFVVSASESTLWLDELEEQTTTAGSVVARPTVYAVNGQDGDVTITAAGLGAYVKPGSGVPKTDLASAVQTSLEKADTALQPADVGTMAAENAADYLTADQTNAAIAVQVGAIGQIVTAQPPAWAGERSKTWNPALCLYNGESPTLRAVRSLIRKGRGGQRVRIAALGDSKTAGSGSAQPQVATNSYPGQLADLIGAKPGFVYGTTWDTRWSARTNVADGGSSQLYYACTGTWSVTFTSLEAFTAFRVAAYISPGGTISVTVDGVAQTAFTVAAGSTFKMSSAYSGFSDTTHVIVLSGTAIRSASTP